MGGCEMKVATAAEMRLIDKQAIEEYGIPGIVLMENAGLAAMKEIEQIIGECRDKKIYIFAGKGNNGGDGFVVARHLYNRGSKVKVFLIGQKTAVHGDAQANLTILERMNIEVIELSRERDWDKAGIAVQFADCLVDAMLGTGIHGEISAEMAQAVDLINESAKPVLSVDIPSGVHSDTGQICGKAVRATRTVTFGLPKPGLLLYPGADCAGQVIVADIGIPIQLLTGPGMKQNQITMDHIRTILPQRGSAAHKGACGRVFVVAGSQGLTGAAFLSSSAALRAGAGLVTLGIAAGLHDIMEVKLTEVMTQPLSEIAKGILGDSSLEDILLFASENDVLAIGPGLGRSPDTMAVVRDVIQLSERPLVIDADALYALNGHTEILAGAPVLAIVTPHPGEMARLTGLSVNEINENRIAVARQAAEQWGSIIVLKGAHSIVAFPDGEIFINLTGNAAMATGGTGDVLTGMIAALIAQGLSSHDAAVAGVYLHGLAGDIAAGGYGAGMLAGDLLAAIPVAVQRVRMK
ncbi:MAG: nnr [Firmicutes bacterium]|nr:nnr [Bacillota bacterium]